jgi:oligoribonuclease
LFNLYGARVSAKTNQVPVIALKIHTDSLLYAMITMDTAATSPAPTLEYSKYNLVWLDMEMTGLRPECDRILEIAVIVTDSTLAIAIEGPVMVIHQNDKILAMMDEWNKNTHSRSGLIERVRASTIDEQSAVEQLHTFLARYVPPGQSPLCGNSICQDRRFIARWMPRFESFFHYRNLDVSTLKELCRRWHPALYRGLNKHTAHTALADIRASIAELKYYRAHFIQCAAGENSECIA